MNKDQIRGAVKIAAGIAQQAGGTLIDSPEQVVKGLRRQVAGKAQERRGDVRDIVEHMKPNPGWKARPTAGAQRPKRTPA